MRSAVVLANLGGPDGPEAVQPFLFNLFNDRAILSVPQPIRFLLASFISRRRTPVAREIYARIGGRSPILPETEAQARALNAQLAAAGGPDRQFKVFVAMRYWHPFLEETAQAVKAWTPDQVLLLPLYPQFSTTTTGSFFKAWDVAAKSVGLRAADARLCCHPVDPQFIAGHVERVRATRLGAAPNIPLRLLFSAHGLPKKVVAQGDPYQWQVERTAAAIVKALDEPGLDWAISYQSRVGPLAWLEPSTEAEIRRAGREGKGLIVVPVAFVSEHSETLVELDLEYGALAAQSGVEPYLRVPTLSVETHYMAGLARLALELAARTGIVAAGGSRICPAHCSTCPYPDASDRVTHHS